MAAKILTSQRLAISGASNRTTALALGYKYAVVCSVDCWIRQGGSGVNAAADTANNFFLGKGVIIEITPTEAADQYIACIGTSGSLIVATLEASS